MRKYFLLLLLLVGSFSLFAATTNVVQEADKEPPDQQQLTTINAAVADAENHLFTAGNVHLHIDPGLSPNLASAAIPTTTSQDEPADNNNITITDEKIPPDGYAANYCGKYFSNVELHVDPGLIFFAVSNVADTNSDAADTTYRQHEDPGLVSA